MAAERDRHEATTSQLMTVQVPINPFRRAFNVKLRLWRLRDSSMAILQIVIAATAAFSFSTFVLGHNGPLLAATVTLSSLGLVRDARPRLVFETVIGMLVGILIAELILIVAGQGIWQLAVALAVTLIVSRFLSDRASFAMAAGIQSLIVIVLPVGDPFFRLWDGMVGGAAALLVTALVPRNLIAVQVRDAQVAIAAIDSAFNAVSQALTRGSRIRAERSLEKARAIAPLMDQWHETADSAIAVAKISPFQWRRRAELERQNQIREHMDYASRNLRVIARRSVYLLDDAQPRPVLAALVREMTEGLRLLGEAVKDPKKVEAARVPLAHFAAQLDPEALFPDGPLADQTFVTAMRPLAVDLLRATGMSEPDAAATVL